MKIPKRIIYFFSTRGRAPNSGMRKISARADARFYGKSDVCLMVCVHFMTRAPKREITSLENTWTLAESWLSKKKRKRHSNILRTATKMRELKKLPKRFLTNNWKCFQKTRWYQNLCENIFDSTKSFRRRSWRHNALHFSFPRKLKKDCWKRFVIELLQFFATSKALAFLGRCSRNFKELRQTK